MFKEYLRAIRLEFSYIKESKVNFIFYLLLPALLIVIFGILTQNKITWLKGAVTYFDFYTPLILPTIILFITTQISILRIIGERSPYGTLDRDLIAIPRPQMYFGKFTAFSLLAIVQSVIVWLITVYMFNVRHVGEPYLSLVFLILTALFGVSLGFLISILTKTKEQAVQLVPFCVLVLFILDIIVTMQSVEIFPNIYLQKIILNLPLVLATSSLTKVMVYGQGLLELSTAIIVFLVWIFGLVLFGVVKFMFEQTGKKRSVFVSVLQYAAVISLLIVIAIGSYPFLKPNWEKFSIDHFNIDEVSDNFNTYPSITDPTPLLGFLKKHVNVDVKDAKEYVWNVQGQQLEAITLVIEVKDKEYLKSLNRQGTELNKEKLDGEEVYSYPMKIKGFDAALFIWDEDRFLLLYAGPKDLGEKVVKKSVSSYPEPPTENSFVPKREDVEGFITVIETFA